MEKTYHGSCHCGAIKYEADIDLSKGTGKCNCSMCAKARVWATSIKPEAFRLQAGEDNLGDYQFNTHSVHHYFCKTCGLKPFGRGDIPEVGGKFVSINLACLDDLEPAELVAAPIQYSDGLNNRWERAPAETRHL